MYLHSCAVVVKYFQLLNIFNFFFYINHIYITNPLQRTLKQEYIDQHTIGWTHVLRGRRATPWYTVIQLHIDNGAQIPNWTKKKLISPELRGWKIIHECWKQAIKMWEGQNTAIHKLYSDKGLTQAHKLMVQVAAQEIQDIQEKAHLAGQNDIRLDKT